MVGVTSLVGKGVGVAVGGNHTIVGVGVSVEGTGVGLSKMGSGVVVRRQADRLFNQSAPAAVNRNSLGLLARHMLVREDLMDLDDLMALRPNRYQVHRHTA